jgi:hypothetical protein
MKETPRTSKNSQFVKLLQCVSKQSQALQLIVGLIKAQCQIEDSAMPSLELIGKINLVESNISEVSEHSIINSDEYSGLVKFRERHVGA